MQCKNEKGMLTMQTLECKNETNYDSETGKQERERNVDSAKCGMQ